MTLLQNIVEENIPVNWTTIFVGWVGPENYSRLINLSDIASFASELIESEKINSSDVYYLAGVENGDEEITGKLIRKLSKNENVNIELEKRKWRLVLLKEVLGDVDSDPLYGTLELLEFWKRWNFPPDSPIEDLKNKKNAPRYSEKEFKELLKKHYKWVEMEKTKLQLK